MMKKFISCIVICSFIFTLFMFPVSAEKKSANPVLTVVTEYGKKDDEIYSAKTLKNYLEKITGKIVYIIDDTAKPQGQAFYIRQSSDKSLPVGSYTLKEDNGNLIIEGSGIRGEIYGVYGFLEKYCGCRWYTSELIEVPKADNIQIPENLNYTYKPYFEYTDTDWVSPCDPEYSLAHGLNGRPYRYLSKEQGGTVEYLSGFCHTLSTQFCSRDKYFSSHPEYFAFREDEGKRVDSQLCLTNPDVLKIVTEEVLKLCKEKYDPDGGIQIISLTQADNVEFCQCEKCRALDEKNGSHAGTMVSFVNAVAKEVRKAGYNDVVLDTFAYTYTRKTPSEVVPDDNVIIRLCSIECCFAHTLDDESCEENRKFMKDLSDWGKICNRIYIWDYTTNYSYTTSIFPNFNVMQKNMQIFYENNVKGVYEEGNYFMRNCDTEFGELRSYLLSKLLQDPYIDYEKTMQEFLKAYYGKAGEPIGEFIHMVSDIAGRNGSHLGIFDSPEHDLTDITDEEVRYLDECWEMAEEYAENDIQLQRIKRSEFSWKTWELHSKRGIFSNKAPWHRMIIAKDDYFKQVELLDIKQTSEGGSNYPRLLATKLFAPAVTSSYDSNIIILALQPFAKIIVEFLRFYSALFRS